ncbi:Hypothetical protein FKW44_009344, partial [Caligus rogercresseyi]
SRMVQVGAVTGPDVEVLEAGHIFFSQDCISLACGRAPSPPGSQRPQSPPGDDERWAPRFLARMDMGVPMGWDWPWGPLETSHKCGRADPVTPGLCSFLVDIPDSSHFLVMS